MADTGLELIIAAQAMRLEKHVVQLAAAWIAVLKRELDQYTSAPSKPPSSYSPYRKPVRRSYLSTVINWAKTPSTSSPNCSPPTQIVRRPTVVTTSRSVLLNIC